MSFFSSWLGSGKARAAGAAGRITVSAPSFKPAVEALELRAMPDATLVTRQPDFTQSTGLLDIPADSAVQVLGASSNGRFLLLQSKATNLSRIIDSKGTPQPQVSAPGQTNIFYLERKDDGTNNITLISAYNPVPTFDTQFVPGQKGLGVAESVPGVSLNAVISDDGQSVAFLSGANAALFDQNIYNASGFAADSGGQDCFVWRATTGLVTLVSKTGGGTAIGGAGGVTNPSISPDGKVVTFLSDFNAQNIAGRTTTFNQSLFLDTNDSPDIFRVDTTNAAAVPEPVSVFYAIQQSLFLGKTANTDLQFQMLGATSGVSGRGMSVDPLGRYVTAGGAGFVGLFQRANSGKVDAFRFTFNVGAGVPTTQNPAPYAIDKSQVTNNIFSGDIFAGLVATSVLPSVNTPGSGGYFSVLIPPTIQTAVDTGSAEVGNAIVALFNADVIFSYRQITPTVNAKLVALPGYTSPATGTGAAQFDLFQKGFINSTIQFRLLSHQAGTATQGVGNLDLRAGGYSITPDAVKILFTSSAPADQVVTDPAQLLAGKILDINKQFDVFQFDGSSSPFTSLASVRTAAVNATGPGESTFPSMTPDGIAIAFQSTVLADVLANTPDGNGAQSDIFVRDIVLRQTILASGVPANIASGNGASTTAVVVRSAVVDRNFFRNFEVLFTSSSTNLDPTVVIDPANPQVFSSKFPIFVSGLIRTLSFSGGEGGFVTISRTDNLGNLIALSKLQPFAGFTGELRVATADFTGDGVPDVAVAAGPGGGPRVSIIDGTTLRAFDNFFAFESGFTGGVYIAAGDLNNAGVAELIVGAGEGGGPRLQVYDVKTRVRTLDQFAYEPSSRTGVHVAAGDFNGDGRNDIFIGAGSGGGPRVRVLSGASLPNQTVLADFFAFNSNDRNGVNISAGDYDSDGKADVVVGSGNGSTPRVIIYNAAYLSLSDPVTSPFDAAPQNPLRVDQAVKFLDFTPFAPSDAVGARAVLRNIDGGKLGGLVVATAGQLPRIQTYSGTRRGVDPLGNDLAPQLLKEQIPYDSLFGNFGAFVG